MPDYDFDLFVIGAGSGGVRAARISAAHGARVAVAEEYRVGGTCVIRGCVPKKLLIYGAHFAEDLRDARAFGWQVPHCEFDWATLRENVLNEVTRLEGLYRNTLENHGVESFAERATLAGPNEIRLADGRRLTAGKILIATGARPTMLACPGHEHGMTSNEVFHLEKIPKRIVIVGGGYIANEFAGIFNELGSKVTLLIRGRDMLRHYDAEIRARLIEISTAKGIRILQDTIIERIIQNTDHTLSAQMVGGVQIECDRILFATGRRPNSDGIGLEQIGVEVDELGAIRVDDDYRTSVSSIFAVGDVINRVQLTPVAIREGHSFADTQFGRHPHRIDYDLIPSAVFSHPPIAAVGMTEAQARERFGEVRVYRSDFRPMKNVLAGRDERALFKMVTVAATARVVGLHMIGPDAPELLQAAAIGVKAGLTKTQFDDTFALHPTMAEELVLLR
jgi:glutathione reductase (NADPH)